MTCTFQKKPDNKENINSNYHTIEKLFQSDFISGPNICSCGNNSLYKIYLITKQIMHALDVL